MEMDEDFDDAVKKKQVLAEQDFSDEFIIKNAMIEFFNVATSITEENKEDIVEKMRAHRNVIVTMMRIYLAKFNNQPFIDKFEKLLKESKEKATKDGLTDKYQQFLYDIQAVGVSLGIREDLAGNIAEQFCNEMLGE